MSLENLKVLITAGPTTEMWDNIRFLSNRSSGKMGYAIAGESLNFGADTTIISGVERKIKNPAKTINVLSARDMFEEVKKRFASCNIFVSTAAVCDFRPERVPGKIKKKNGVPDITLLPNPDILKWVGEKKKTRIVAGFSLEEDLSEKNARQKMEEKNCDIMVANTPSNLGENRKSFLLLTPETSDLYKNISLKESAKVIFNRCLKIKKSS